MDLKIKGKKAIVTGASRGIGLRIARQLAEEGVDVAICARNQAGVDEVVNELKQKGVNAIGDSVDITDKESYVEWIDSAAKRLGGLDIFVSNVSAGPLTAGEEGWKMEVATDIFGTVHGCETAIPHLRKSEVGSIVLIASISGLMSKQLKAPGILAYGSCKAALIAYGSQISKQLAPEGIRVNMVSPGPIFFKNGPWDHIKQNTPQVYDEVLEECVIGRLGTPEEVANSVVFLASPLSGNTVGQNLHVDGGYMMHIAF